jgi:hypothetical protein
MSPDHTDTGGIVEAVTFLVGRVFAQKSQFGPPFISLLEIKLETFSTDKLPKDLKCIPVSKPSSKQ